MKLVHCPSMDEKTGFDPQRRLCPDGTCTGVIGSDGRCTECRRTAGTEAGAGGAGTSVFAVLDAAEGEVADANPDSGDAGGGGGSQHDDWEPGSGFDPNRRLCPDGACVGVIGSNGACTVCGRVAG